MGGHLRFKHAQQNMFHSPKVEDGDKKANFSFLRPIFSESFIEEFCTAIYPKPLELLTLFQR